MGQDVAVAQYMHTGGTSGGVAPWLAVARAILRTGRIRARSMRVLLPQLVFMIAYFIGIQLGFVNEWTWDMGR